MNQEENVNVLYEYLRNGVVYTTPNEMIASMRSDNGVYTQIVYTR